MKKFLITGMALAPCLPFPPSASADVPRCEASGSTSTTVTTATFTALQPKDTEHQFGNVWKHDFTVIVNADGSFIGHRQRDGQRRRVRLGREHHRLVRR